MKKFFAAVCAAVMVLGSTMTAFAAPSATASDVSGIKKPAELVTAIDATATKSDDGKVVVKEASEASVNALSAEVVDILQSKNTKDNKAYKANVMAVADIKIEGKNGGTVTIAVPSVKKGDTIIVLHYTGSVWEEISGVKVEDGKVTATFSSLSPVAIVKVSEKVTSDKTGVGVSTLSLIAAAGLAGAVVCGKKKSN